MQTQVSREAAKPRSREAAKNQELWTSFKPSKRRAEKCLVEDVLSDHSFVVVAALLSLRAPGGFTGWAPDGCSWRG